MRFLHHIVHSLCGFRKEYIRIFQKFPLSGDRCLRVFPSLKYQNKILALFTVEQYIDMEMKDHTFSPSHHCSARRKINQLKIQSSAKARTRERNIVVKICFL